MTDLKKFVCVDAESCEDCLTVGKTYEGTRNGQGYVTIKECDDGKVGTFNPFRLRTVKEE